MYYNGKLELDIIGSWQYKNPFTDTEAPAICSDAKLDTKLSYARFFQTDTSLCKLVEIKIGQQDRQQIEASSDGLDYATKQAIVSKSSSISSIAIKDMKRKMRYILSDLLWWFTAFIQVFLYRFWIRIWKLIIILSLEKILIFIL